MIQENNAGVLAGAHTEVRAPRAHRHVHVVSAAAVCRRCQQHVCVGGYANQVIDIV